MVIDLAGRTALVTGATAGIGRAIAAGLHAAGATVIVNGLTPELVDEAIEWLGGGERWRGIAADLGTAEGCAALVDAASDLDILVNNVGVAEMQPVFEIPDAEWERLFAVNVMSGIRLARHYIPGMVQRGWGRAVFIASEAGLHIPREMVHYGVSKTAVLAVARGFAESVAGSGVTVNSVLPGPTRTDAAGVFLKRLVDDGAANSLDEAEQLLMDQLAPTSLLGRFADPAEVANLVVYLASDQAAVTTGAAMRVDGGVVRAVA
jgi:NAD(P)-dependent dehydrogenase (short-subunit alcohol dehydrogenase family)